MLGETASLGDAVGTIGIIGMRKAEDSWAVSCCNHCCWFWKPCLPVAARENLQLKPYGIEVPGTTYLEHLRSLILKPAPFAVRISAQLTKAPFLSVLNLYQSPRHPKPFIVDALAPFCMKRITPASS